MYNWIYNNIGINKLFNLPEWVLAIEVILCIVVPYMLGSINTAIIISKKLYNDDIRRHGSGNAGMTNMQRTYGWKAALFTLLGDCAKQFVSILFASFLLGIRGAYIAGMFCILGHIAPVYYRFKGGKGVLTAATMILMLNPTVFLVVFALFILVILVFRYVSLASVVAGFAYPGILYMYLKFTDTMNEAAMICAFVMGLTIILMHRSNLERLWNGKETKIRFSKKKEEPQRDYEQEEIDATEYIDMTGKILNNSGDENEKK